MKGKKENTVSGGYIKGALVGMICSAVVLYALNMFGVIIVSSSGGLSLVSILQWCHGNLGFSIIPFSIIAVGYVLYLYKLVQLLGGETVSARDVCAVEEKIDLLISIFFGIGVIWTAIGMRNALLVSLGSMDAETAARKGAFSILRQLVDGGILLSLSTTIVGGIGGYFMRMIKEWTAGPQLNAFFDDEEITHHQGILDRLDRIAVLLEKNTPEAPVL